MSESKTEIKTVPPEQEPEYVDAHSTPIRDKCAEYKGDYVEGLEKCGREATHTVVMRSPNGDLAEVPMCEECGEPEDVAPWLRGE